MLVSLLSGILAPLSSSSSIGSCNAEPVAVESSRDDDDVDANTDDDVLLALSLHWASLAQPTSISAYTVAHGTVNKAAFNHEYEYKFSYTSSGKHEFAHISMAAIHIHTSTGYL